MMILAIIQQIIMPIILLIGVGMILQRAFHLDMKTFSKLILYYYIPALTFVKIYEAKATTTLLWNVFGFLLLQFLVLFLIGKLVSKLGKHPKPMESSFSNSIVLTNNGNVGIPVNDLAFHHNPLALSIQMMVVLFELFLTFTYGLINASSATMGLMRTVIQFIKMPVLYCLILGLLFNLFQIKLPDFVWIPLNTVANGMLSLALVSIGAQIATLKLNSNTGTVLLSSFIRLIISPLIAYGIIYILDLHGTVAQALWIASAIPTSRNSASLALEYGNEPEFAAQTVLISTLFSSVTLTAVIYYAMILFP
ncbi:AEC family transporter [Paenibacillus psychroresistens]|uniref:AEC family transporter n=1 Tax=Paenibacillus psychroresistens TaxID=1778678 RepID=A0A6B8RUS2_9BACL|nr:AEC family transporter [Paenibacillus psychroresistens]QGQ99046.1 AEC family transporter [Paenibacillus psychroresistens]